MIWSLSINHVLLSNSESEKNTSQTASKVNYQLNDTVALLQFVIIHKILASQI